MEGWIYGHQQEQERREAGPLILPRHPLGVAALDADYGGKDD
jgi:hypothetical protein